MIHTPESLDWPVLFNELPRGVGILDCKGVPLYSNTRLKSLFDDESRILKIRYAPLSDEWLEFQKNFLHSDIRQSQMTLAIPIRQKGTRWFSIRMMRINQDSHIFVFEDDITEQHYRERMLKNARYDAEKATKTKSDFLANMSHEIRTPIHTIIGMSELMNTTILDQEQEEYSSQIRFSADVLLSLINDVLDFSKIEAGQLELEYTACNLQDLIEDSVDLVALEAHKKGVEVGFLADTEADLAVQGDPTRLRQIIMNLVNNAVKFTEDGQVMVYLRLVEQSDTMTTIRFSVEDSGIGISSSKKNTLFEAFTQADSSTTRRYGGTGLGLSICRNLVAQMGGLLEVESAEGLGSEFFFTLTFDRVLSEAENEISYGEDLKDISVLLVDDNWKIRNILVRYLELWGCRVDEAGSGREAFQKMKEKVRQDDQPYDICITDQLMPDIDGWQLASQVRAHDTLTKTALILMSLKAKGTEEAKMKLLGWFSAYITKPIRKRDLWDKCILAMFPDKAEAGELEELEDISTRRRTGADDSRPTGPKTWDGKVLIAEDHPVNRKLFEAILTKQGLQVILAENGKSALEMAERENPDLIFMDCQMPVMNGYEATKKIREIGIKTPIVAVTANALKGEKEKCLESGMTDFLPKPFKNRDIQPILDRWLDMEVLEEAESSENFTELIQDIPELPEELEPVAEAENQSNDDNSVFDMKQALDTFMGDLELLVSLLKPFIAQMETYLDGLENPEIFSQMEEVRGIGHAIKGSSRNLSMNELGEAAEKLEYSGRDNKPEDARSAYEEVKTAFERVKLALLPYLEK